MNKYLAIILCLIIYACTTQKNTVHLKGQIEGVQSPLSLRYTGSLSTFTSDKDFTLQTDENGRFDTILPLTQEGYYYSHIIQLYLTPGDEVEIYRTGENKHLKIKGTHATQNQYLNEQISLDLRDRKFPAKENRLAEFMEVKPVLDELAEKAMCQLEAIKGATSGFKDMERARIKIELIRGYISGYLQIDGFDELSEEEQDQRRTAYYEAVVPTYVLPLMSEVMDEKYLELEEARRLFSTIQYRLMSYFKDIQLSQRAIEMEKGFGYVRALKQRATPDLAKEATSYAQKMVNADFKECLFNSIANAERHFPGKPAFDVEMEDANGKLMHLSDFKGKVIYIDFWATWCVPCRKEAPFYEALAKKFEEKDILFIPISIDAKKEAWKKYVAEKQSPLSHMLLTPKEVERNTKGGEAWAIGAVPRFVIIDKDFMLIDYFAPNPSSEEIEALLNKALE